MPRPGAEGLEPQAVQEVVDGLQATDDAELAFEDAAEVLAPQGTHAVGLGRTGPEPIPELLLLAVGQRPLAAATGLHQIDTTFSE